MEKLTGKCKEDFDRWIADQVYSRFSDFHHIYELDEVCANALIIEFFDSVRILIEIQLVASRVFSFDIHTELICEEHNVYQNRLEATNSAIIKANKIYNDTK